MAFGAQKIIVIWAASPGEIRVFDLTELLEAQQLATGTVRDNAVFAGTDQDAALAAVGKQLSEITGGK